MNRWLVQVDWLLASCFTAIAVAQVIDMVGRRRSRNQISLGMIFQLAALIALAVSSPPHRTFNYLGVILFFLGLAWDRWTERRR